MGIKDYGWKLIFGGGGCIKWMEIKGVKVKWKIDGQSEDYKLKVEKAIYNIKIS